jgi:cytochrome c-type biogenesis protein CcmH/NrfG
MAHRESEDLEVSRYYASVGNHAAAYMRAKDAVRVVPGDSAAHFFLGEAARALNKKDEAEAEYRVSLQLAPEGDYAEKSRKALVGLGH